MQRHTRKNEMGYAPEGMYAVCYLLHCTAPCRNAELQKCHSVVQVRTSPHVAAALAPAAPVAQYLS